MFGWMSNSFFPAFSDNLTVRSLLFIYLRSSIGGQLDGLCFLVAYQLNSLFIFMMLFLFNVQLRNKYDDDDDLSVCLLNA